MCTYGRSAPTAARMFTPSESPGGQSARPPRPQSGGLAVWGTEAPSCHIATPQVAPLPSGDRAAARPSFGRVSEDRLPDTGPAPATAMSLFRVKTTECRVGVVGLYDA